MGSEFGHQYFNNSDEYEEANLQEEEERLNAKNVYTFVDGMMCRIQIHKIS